MSYCRFSSMDFQCDVYAYETETGYQIHVARSKYVFNEALPPPLSEDAKADELFVYMQKRDKILQKSTLVDIGLPFDGEDYLLPDLESFKEKMLELRVAGYRIPDHAFAEIDEELKEEQKP